MTRRASTFRQSDVAGATVERSPLGSFEAWSRRIRAPLMGLGHADPCETTLKMQEQDPLLVALMTVMTQWQQRIGLHREVTAQQVINEAINVVDFHVALLAVAGAQGRGSNTVSNERLGRWLKRVEGRVVSRMTLRRMGVRDGYSLWSLLPV
jgi:putative DNA primase/helicase